MGLSYLHCGITGYYGWNALSGLGQQALWTDFSLQRSALECLNTKVGAELLCASTGRVGQMLSVDAEAVGGVTDTIALS